MPTTSSRPCWRITARVKAADDAGRQRFHEVLIHHQRLQTLPADQLSGKVEAIAAVFEGLMVRALRNPDLEGGAVLRAAAIALRALIDTGPTAAP